MRFAYRAEWPPRPSRADLFWDHMLAFSRSGTAAVEAERHRHAATGRCSAAALLGFHGALLYAWGGA